MDGIGFIGGPKSISGMPGTKKSASPQTKSDSNQIEDGVVTGYYSGPEIQDPRKAFNFEKPEVGQPVSQETGGSVKVTAEEFFVEMGYLPPGKITEEYFISGASDGFGSFGLNGPNSPQSGIETLSGVKLGESNPKFLFLE